MVKALELFPIFYQLNRLFRSESLMERIIPKEFPCVTFFLLLPDDLNVRSVPFVRIYWNTRLLREVNITFVKKDGEFNAP